MDIGQSIEVIGHRCQDIGQYFDFNGQCLPIYRTQNTFYRTNQNIFVVKTLVRILILFFHILGLGQPLKMEGFILDNIEKEPQAKTDNRNYNKIRVNNHINFTVNFGDSLNLLALIAGVFFIKTVSKKTKQKSPKRKKALILS